MQEPFILPGQRAECSPVGLACMLCFAGHTEGILFKEKKFINTEGSCSKRDLYIPFQVYFCLVKFVSMLGLTLSRLPVDGVPKKRNSLKIHVES